MKLSRAAHHSLKKYHTSAKDESAVLVRSGPHTLHGFQLENPAGGAEVFLQFFDAASSGAVTVGTTAPLWSIMVPTLDGMIIPPQELPIESFALGIVIAATATRTGAGAPNTEDPAVSLWYAPQ
jgi:hypothetical protein